MRRFHRSFQCLQTDQHPTCAATDGEKRTTLYLNSLDRDQKVQSLQGFHAWACTNHLIPFHLRLQLRRTPDTEGVLWPVCNICNIFTATSPADFPWSGDICWIQGINPEAPPLTSQPLPFLGPGWDWSSGADLGSSSTFSSSNSSVLCSQLEASFYPHSGPSLGLHWNKFPSSYCLSCTGFHVF